MYNTNVTQIKSTMNKNCNLYQNYNQTLKSEHMIIIFGIQTNWTKFRPLFGKWSEIKHSEKSEQSVNSAYYFTMNFIIIFIHRAKTAKSRPFLGNLDLLTPKFQEF